MPVSTEMVREILIHFPGVLCLLPSSRGLLLEFRFVGRIVSYRSNVDVFILCKSEVLCKTLVHGF